MRKSFTFALVLVVALTFSAPTIATAAVRTAQPAGSVATPAVPPLVRLVRAVKRFLPIIKINGDPTMPIPGPTPPAGGGGN